MPISLSPFSALIWAVFYQQLPASSEDKRAHPDAVLGDDLPGGLGVCGGQAVGEELDTRVTKRVGRHRGRADGAKDLALDLVEGARAAELELKGDLVLADEVLVLPGAELADPVDGEPATGLVEGESLDGGIDA
jgi:hypothetical protein